MDSFNFTDERFADIQMLRYRMDDFESMSLRQKLYIYCLAKATLCGRDITTDQFGRYNLIVRKTLEAIYCNYRDYRDSDDFKGLEEYLKRVWFSNGIYHHYGCDKFVPSFTESFFCNAFSQLEDSMLPHYGQLKRGQLLSLLCKVIFDRNFLPKRVNKADGEDLVLTSACNYYDSLTQQEVENFYALMRDDKNPTPPSYGLNSTLRKKNGQIYEDKWKETGLYGNAIKEITSWLRKAAAYSENELQSKLIDLLISYYRSGDLRDFDLFSIEWLKEQQGRIDFINGFIEVYGDPLGFKGSWEGIVTYKDNVATKRTQAISQNAQWFEDHSPVDPRFRKAKVTGVTANVVCAAMLGGDEYPSTAIGINLPNADWIRALHGSKSITIGNLTHAYSMAARGNGFLDEFVIDKPTRNLIEKFGDVCDDLHTDLHECLGHGSGQLLAGVSADSLKAYGDTIEEARADLFGLYYIADKKLLEMGLLSDADAFHAQYYTYMMNGLMTQLTRIQPGNMIEEAHMRNRALIAWWTLEHCPSAVEMVKKNDKTYVCIHDYDQLRDSFAVLLAEIQRIKSEGDFEAARLLVERYAVNVDPALHSEILARYKSLDIAPYKGFINPRMALVRNEDGVVTDVRIDYDESYEHQMLRYSSEYGFL